MKHYPKEKKFGPDPYWAKEERRKGRLRKDPTRKRNTALREYSMALHCHLRADFDQWYRYGDRHPTHAVLFNQLKAAWLAMRTKISGPLDVWINDRGQGKYDEDPELDRITTELVQLVRHQLKHRKVRRDQASRVLGGVCRIQLVLMQFEDVRALNNARMFDHKETLEYKVHRHKNQNAGQITTQLQAYLNQQMAKLRNPTAPIPTPPSQQIQYQPLPPSVHVGVSMTPVFDPQTGKILYWNTNNE